RTRIGSSTNNASSTTSMFIPAATRNTASHEPVAFFSTLANGTRKAEVPLAVYSIIELAVAYLVPNRSVQVEGNRLNISPQVKNISAAQITNVQGLEPNSASSQ